MRQLPLGPNFAGRLEFTAPLSDLIEFPFFYNHLRNHFGIRGSPEARLDVPETVTLEKWHDNCCCLFQEAWNTDFHTQGQQ